MSAGVQVDELERDLTPRQIAAATQLSYKTVLREIDRGRLHAIRVGAALRVPESSYLAWRELSRVRSSRAPAAPAPARRPRASRDDRQPGSVARLRALEEE